MSIAVLGYQAAIASIIIGAAIFSGRGACISAVVLASVWTLTQVFMNWLMALQFITVILAAAIGLAIAPNEGSELEQRAEPVTPHPPAPPAKDNSGGWTILIILGVVLAIIVITDKNQTSKSYSDSKNPSAPSVVTPRNVPVPRSGLEQSTITSQKNESGDSQLSNIDPRQKIASPGYNTTREVQEILTNLGYRPGAIDGVFGSGTRGAISQFQNDIGHYPDGYISTSLLNELRKRSK